MEREDERHLFIHCDAAKDCWTEVGLCDEVLKVDDEVNSINAWLNFILINWRSDQVKAAAVVLWSIWGERNQRVWEKKSRTARLVVEAGFTAQLEWEQARAMPNDRSDDRNHHVLSCTKWHNPPIGKLKCNVDAAFRERELRKVYKYVELLKGKREGRLK
ncbi:hypothetical protein LINPERHAP1_LOCUS604 [Linum perenne]